jgi:hypothetical protein
MARRQMQFTEGAVPEIRPESLASVTQSNSLDCCYFLCSFQKDLERHALPRFAKQGCPRTHPEPLTPPPPSFLNRRSEVRFLSGAPFLAIGSGAWDGGGRCGASAVASLLLLG